MCIRDRPERVVYKLCTVMFSHLRGHARQYLTDFCRPASEVAPWQHLRSASRRFLDMPHYRTSSLHWPAFYVAGPLAWNSLPDYMRKESIGRDTFRQHLKMFLFASYWCTQCIRGFTIMRYANWHWHLWSYGLRRVIGLRQVAAVLITSNSN